jgi:hypothetical protein
MTDSPIHQSGASDGVAQLVRGRTDVLWPPLREGGDLA